jgi:hypothetical protein
VQILLNFVPNSTPQHHYDPLRFSLFVLSICSGSFSAEEHPVEALEAISRLLGIPFFCDLCYALRVLHHTYKGAAPMEWTTPQHEEIDLNCEISSYANAEL